MSECNRNLEYKYTLDDYYGTSPDEDHAIGKVIPDGFFSERAARGGGGGGAARLFFFFSPCSADHERYWPPCKVVFFGLATNALNVRNNNNNNNNNNLPRIEASQPLLDGS